MPRRLNAALAIMWILLASMIGASTGDGLCADDEVRGAAFAVASVLEERRVLNSGPGEIHFAVVMDWRREACELL